MKCPEFPPIEVCSNNGYCDETIGKCICNEGWSSVGDFAVEEGIDCNIHAKTVQSLWAIDILVAMVSFGIAVRFLLRKRNMMKQSKWYDPILLLPLTFIVCCTASLALGLIRMVSINDRVIGKDAAATTLFGTVISSSITTNCLYLYIILKFLTGYTKMMAPEVRERAKSDVHYISRMIPFLILLQSIGGYLLLLMLQNNIDDVQQVAVASFTMIAVADALFCSLTVGKAMNPIIHHFENHINQSKALDTSQSRLILDDILKKLKRVRIVVIFIGPVVTAQFIIFGAFLFILRSFSYLSPMLCATGNVTVFGLLSLQNSTASGSSSASSAAAIVRVSKVTSNPGVVSHSGSRDGSIQLFSSSPSPMKSKEINDDQIVPTPIYDDM